MTINWMKLCETSHQISVDKGWQETERTYHEDTILFHSELSEALEDYRANRGLNDLYFEIKLTGGEKIEGDEALVEALKKDGTLKDAKPCGIPIELADFLIRLCQFCGTKGLAGPFAFSMQCVDVNVPTSLPELLAVCHRDVSDAYEYWQARTEYNDNLLSKAAYRIVRFCETNKIDIEKAIALKEAFNRMRPHKHGGKKI